MWRVDDQERGREARLCAIQARNERRAAAQIPVDYAERVNRAFRHYGVERGGGHRQLTLPPLQSYMKDHGGKSPLEAIDWRGLDVTAAWVSTMVNRVASTLTSQKETAKVTVASWPSRLSLADSPITDAAFSPIQRLKALRSIDISRCTALTDESIHLIRRHFSGSLEELDISECRHFTGDALCQLWRDCAKLHTLRAQGCVGLTDAFLQCVAITKKAQQLRLLEIRHCKSVTSSGVSHIATSSTKTMNVTTLSIGDCLGVDNMAFFGFENSCTVKNLVSLDLSGLNIDETGISWIAKGCKQLEHLDLTRCRSLNDFAMLLLSPLLVGQLRVLKLEACVHVSDQGFKNLFSIAEARRASIVNTDEDEDGYPPLPLRILNLEGCSLLSDETLRLLGVHCGTLTKLNLIGLRRVTDAGVLAVCKGCPRLTSIKISGRYITDQTFKLLGKLSLDLTRVHVSERLDLQTPECLLSLTSGVRPDRFVKLDFSATNICDVGVSILATSCTALRSINLSKCATVTDVAVEAVAYCCHDLRVLLLSNVKALTDRSLAACAMMHLPLELVDLCGNTNITDGGVRALASTCQTLQELRLKGCDRLSFQTTKQVSLLLPHTRTPTPPPLSQRLATGGANTSAILVPLPSRHVELIRRLVQQYESACVLQAKFRRWKQKEASALFLARRKFQRETRAARKIQRCMRSFLSWRRYLWHMNLAKNVQVVVYVQAHVRGNQSRFRTTVYRFTACHAARCIQRGYRPHFVARMRVRVPNAITIQRVYRGFKGRQAFKQALHARRVEKAELIWHWYRRCLHRRETQARARWLVTKIHNIQGQWRKYTRRRNLTTYLGYYRHHATMVQRMWRGFATRRRVARLRVVWNAAAVAIQRVYRSYRARCIVQQYRAQANANATIIQKNWRRFAGRQQYRRSRSLVVQMQRMGRYALAVRKLRHVVRAAIAVHRNKAATAIARVYRGHLGRRRALLFRKIRNASYARKGQDYLQAWIRQGLVRAGAAIRLQRFVRRYQARRGMLKLKSWRQLVAARCLQRYMRDWMRRLRLKRKREQQTHAAMTLQRVYRGHLGRLAFKQERHRQACLWSVKLLQRVYRGFAARKLFRQLRNEMTSAAKMLQRAYRGRHARKLYEISQATAALKAKDKYEKSLLGMISNARNPMDELYFRAKLPHERDVLQKLLAKWHANRVTQERAGRKLTREYKTNVHAATEETVAHHLIVRRKLYGVTENVYVSHREFVERQERQEQLQHELVDLHVRVRLCKQALREAVASRRMLDGKEVMEILRAYRLAGSDNQADG